jgi:hypothetical protein
MLDVKATAPSKRDMRFTPSVLLFMTPLRDLSRNYPACLFSSNSTIILFAQTLPNRRQLNRSQLGANGGYEYTP